jgi:hypothetical protein
MTREELEQKALAVCSGEIYFDLVNVIEDMSDADIQELIDCDGDFAKELAVSESQK